MAATPAVSNSNMRQGRRTRRGMGWERGVMEAGPEESANQGQGHLLFPDDAGSRRTEEPLQS
jgi:hypothetical protein